MNMFVSFYIIMGIIFMLTDIIAGKIAKSKPNILASVLVGFVWPIAIPLAILLSAVLLDVFKTYVINNELLTTDVVKE